MGELGDPGEERRDPRDHHLHAVGSALVFTALVQVLTLWLAYMAVFGWLASFVLVWVLWSRARGGGRSGRRVPLCYGGRRMATFLAVYALACYPMARLFLTLVMGWGVSTESIFTDLLEDG